MITQVDTVNFHGTELAVAVDQDGTRWVGIRRICEDIGLDWTGQLKKISGDGRFNCGVMSTVGRDGKERSMICLRISKINGWLYTINPNKVRPECRAMLLAYQEEVEAVLFHHFMPEGGTEEELRATLTRVVAQMTALEENHRVMEAEHRGAMAHVMQIEDILELRMARVEKYLEPLLESFNGNRPKNPLLPD